MSDAQGTKTSRMNKAVLGIGVAALVLMAHPAWAQQPDAEPIVAFQFDKEKAKAGGKVFGAKACAGCHTIGKGRLAGPDLAGVLDRRSEAWARKFLSDPNAMFETDETAKALLKEYNNVKMPNMKLTDEQVDQLLHYIVEQGSKAKKK